MSISEFEAILDNAEKEVVDGKMFFAEVYFLMEQFEKHGRSVRLQEVIEYAKAFEVTQNRRKASIDPTMASIASMGVPLSREERRKMSKKKGGSATKPKNRRKK